MDYFVCCTILESLSSIFLSFPSWYQSSTILHNLFWHYFAAKYPKTKTKSGTISHLFSYLWVSLFHNVLTCIPLWFMVIIHHRQLHHPPNPMFGNF